LLGVWGLEWTNLKKEETVITPVILLLRNLDGREAEAAVGEPPVLLSLVLILQEASFGLISKGRKWTVINQSTHTELISVVHRGVSHP